MDFLSRFAVRRWRRRTSCCVRGDPHARGSRAAGRGAGASRAVGGGAAADGATWSQVRVEGTRAVSRTRRRAVLLRVARSARSRACSWRRSPSSRSTRSWARSPKRSHQQGRAQAKWMWNTQDYASAVTALAALDQRRRAQGERAVRVRSGNRVILQAQHRPGAARDSTISLAGLLPNGRRRAGAAPLARCRPGHGRRVLLLHGDRSTARTAGHARRQGHSRRTVVRAARRRHADHARRGGRPRARAASHHGAVNAPVRGRGRRAAGGARGGGPESPHGVGDGRARGNESGTGRAGRT